MAAPGERLEDYKPPAKLKLSALWASLMFLYIYGDYFYMYAPGKLEAMARGDLGIGQATDALLIGVTTMMAIPSLMIFLSLALPPTLNRWLNVLLGLAYAAIVGLTMVNAEAFYLYLGALDILVTLTIAWIALRWPRTQAAPQ
ncbi:MAG: hypothetical protein JNJ73_00905 [Hyphomonadaceae bacterium]|nr:hypothetical protein [Hyphomonadaceae bacterium]